MSDNSNKMWGGRFATMPSDLMQEINQSISFDWQLYKEDIQGSIAHAKMLAATGIISNEESFKIVEGLKESVASFSETVDGARAEDVMNLVLMTQYFDTIKDIGASSKSNTILIPHSPGGMADVGEQMRNAVITGNAVTDQASDHS